MTKSQLFSKCQVFTWTGLLLTKKKTSLLHFPKLVETVFLDKLMKPCTKHSIEYIINIIFFKCWILILMKNSEKDYVISSWYQYILFFLILMKTFDINQFMTSIFNKYTCSFFNPNSTSSVSNQGCYMMIKTFITRLKSVINDKF